MSLEESYKSIDDAIRSTVLKCGSIVFSHRNSMGFLQYNRSGDLEIGAKITFSISQDSHQEGFMIPVEKSFGRVKVPLPRNDNQVVQQFLEQKEDLTYAMSVMLYISTLTNGVIAARRKGIDIDISQSYNTIHDQLLGCRKVIRHYKDTVEIFPESVLSYTVPYRIPKN